MKKIYVFLLLSLAFSACKDREFDPIDIFEEEEKPPTDEEGNILADSSILNVGVTCNQVDLFAYRDRVQEISNGYEVKGTLFTQTRLGLTALTSGDFTITKGANGDLVKLDGFGSTLMPEVGDFAGITEFSDIFGANLSYGNGSQFASLDPTLPFQDESCYFRFNLDPAADFKEGIVGGPMMMGNTLVNFKNLFLNVDAPAIFMKGDLYFFDKNTKPVAVADGASKFKKFKAKAGKLSPKFSISDVSIGVSAEPHFVFTPGEFSEELEEIVGGTNFESFNGSLYLKGTVPLKKYPIDVTGEFVYDNSYAGHRLPEIFENGLDDTAYRLGFNGKVEFGHFLLDLLPADLRVELGNATLQQQFALTGESYMRFAGEYDSARLFDELLGPEIAQILPTTTYSGKMYFNVGTELSEWEMYLENQMEINIPGVGRQPFQQAILHLNNEGIYVSGLATLPYGIGEIKLTGELKKDGTFALKGMANAGVDFGKGVKLGSALAVEVSNDGVFLNGMLQLPGGISDFTVEGELSSERVLLKGTQRTNINFGSGEALQTDLSLEANSQTGVFLHGFMQSPLQVAKVEVDGEISARGLALRGLIAGKVDFGVTKLTTDLSLNATTWGGAALSGQVDVPLVIIGGNIAVTGFIYGPTSFGLNGKTGAFIDLKVASANANVELGFSQSSITIGAEAEFCVADDSALETCAGVGLSFKPNWATGELNICGELPVVGEKCI
ncbi:hypothetical protein [Jiulongibacter sp. NS-SX5]|uniref:hypothetical protein n=1 Tax=Jiulongibacter sp. NS-SX5 TaxID=3463854 RepID=UPI00405A3E7C